MCIYIYIYNNKKLQRGARPPTTTPATDPPDHPWLTSDPPDPPWLAGVEPGMADSASRSNGVT